MEKWEVFHILTAKWVMIFRGYKFLRFFVNFRYFARFKVSSLRREILIENQLRRKMPEIMPFNLFRISGQYKNTLNKILYTRTYPIAGWSFAGSRRHHLSSHTMMSLLYCLHINKTQSTYNSSEFNSKTLL